MLRPAHDSLIFTDMVELARNRAVADLILLSGDEDVRIGVQLAQSFGVRIHLVGVKPSAGNQSPELRQEADTCSELDLDVLEKIITMRPIPAAVPSKKPIVQKTLSAVNSPATVATAPTGLESVVDPTLGEMTEAEINGTVGYMSENSNNVPHEVDSKVLARCREKLGQYLDDASRKRVRKYLRQRLKELSK